MSLSLPKVWALLHLDFLSLSHSPYYPTSCILIDGLLTNPQDHSVKKYIHLYKRFHMHKCEICDFNNAITCMVRTKNTPHMVIVSDFSHFVWQDCQTKHYLIFHHSLLSCSQPRNVLNACWWVKGHCWSLSFHLPLFFFSSLPHSFRIFFSTYLYVSGVSGWDGELELGNMDKVCQTRCHYVSV